MNEYLLIIIFSAVSMASSEVCAQKAEHPSAHSVSKFLSVKNESEYSLSFLEAYENGPSHVVLQDSLFIMGGDTDYFPTWLRLGKEYCLTAHSKGKDYELDLTRTNYTDLRYRFAVISKGRLLYERKGTAILDLNFWIAGQPIENDQNEIVSLGDTFYDNEKDSNYELSVGQDEAGRHILAYIAHTSPKNKYALLCEVLLTTN